MTRKVATLCAGLLFIGGSLSAQAQVVPNYWPAFPYDPEIALGLKEMPPFRKFKGYAKYIPNRIPDEVWNQKISKERVLGPDGVEMVPVAPYSADQTETWIAVNPTNPNNIIASSNDSRFNGPGRKWNMAAYYTLDGGVTWLESKTPDNPFIATPSGVGATIFDPGIMFDTKGRAYLVFGMTQSINGDYDEGDNGIFVSYSDDGGQTWEYSEPVTLWNSGSAGQPFEDKYLATADVNPESQYKDNLYIVWTRFKKNQGIYMSRSTDRGQSWSVASMIPGGNIGSYQSPVPAVGPEGNVYVAWRRENGDNTSAVFQVSKNGGQSWALPTAVVAQSVKTTGVDLPNDNSSRNVLADKQRMRISSYPVLDVDRSGGAHRGRIYIAQSGKDASGTPGVFMTYSDNEGQTWSESKRVDNNLVGNDVFMPALAVDPLTGTLGILYYTSQNDPEKNQGVDAYIALSSDGGETFTHIRLTAETFFIDDPNDVSNQGDNFYWGDYTSLAAREGKFFPCYWAPKTPNGNYFTLDVYTNLLSKGPRPVEDLGGAASTQSPGTIVLTWNDPTLNMFGQQLGEYKVIIYRRIKGEGDFQKLGEVAAGTETYEDNTTVDGVEYEYRVVVVSDELESPAIVITAVAGGALKPMPPTLLTARPHEDGIEVEFESPEFHVDNTPFHDYFEVALYSGDQKLGSVPVSGSNVQAGEVSKVVFELPTKQFRSIRVKAVGKRGDKVTESDPSAEMLAYSGSPIASLLVDFDNADTVAYYTGPDKWGRTTKVAVSGQNAFTDSPDGDYKGLKNYEVIFAPFVVPADKTSLSFEHIALVDPGDNAEVLISDDFGKSWKWLRSYSINSSPKFKKPVDNQQWDTQSLDLSQHVGDTLYVRFALTTTVLSHNDGWYIDDVRVDNLPVGVGEAVTPTAYLGQAYPNPVSTTARIDFRLRNESHVKLELFNAVGTSVAVLVDEVLSSGVHTAPVLVDHLPNGMYFYRLTLNDGTTLVQKLSVVR